MQAIFKDRRISQMDLLEVYFWTDTIKDWKNLLKKDKYKELIIESLSRLYCKGLISRRRYIL